MSHKIKSYTFDKINTMKKLILLLSIISIVACKKKTIEPTPVPKRDISRKVLFTFETDSLGHNTKWTPHSISNISINGNISYYPFSGIYSQIKGNGVLYGDSALTLDSGDVIKISIGSSVQLSSIDSFRIKSIPLNHIRLNTYTNINYNQGSITHNSSGGLTSYQLTIQ